MPPKVKNGKKRVPRSRVRRAPRGSNTTTKELSQLTKMVAKLNVPKNDVTDIGRMLLAGGNMLGSMVGLPKIFGSGDYALDQNTLWKAGAQVPSMHSSNESITLRHREYITDVAMNGTAFTTQTFPLNPGVFSTFPFLSTIAQNFQEYTFLGLVFEYKTTSATALVSGTNTAMGSVQMAFQYRADAPVPATKQGLLNEMWSVDTVPSQNCILPVECAPKENPFQIQYVRNFLAPPGDIKMYDLGTLVVATSGGQPLQTNVIGEIWVSYEVELRKPLIAAPIGTGIQSAYYTNGVTAGNFYTNALPLGNPPGRVLDTIGPAGTGLSVSSTVITFPVGCQGYYLLSFMWAGTPVVPTVCTINTTLVNCTNASGSFFNGTNGCSQFLADFVILITPGAIGPATITFSGCTLPATQLCASFVVTQVAFSTGWTSPFFHT